MSIDGALLQSTSPADSAVVLQRRHVTCLLKQHLKGVLQFCRNTGLICHHGGAVRLQQRSSRKNLHRHLTPVQETARACNTAHASKAGLTFCDAVPVLMQCTAIQLFVVFQLIVYCINW
jgi:hypothetical protein